MQAKRKDLEQRFAAAAADLEHERQLHTALRHSSAVLEGVRESREAAIAVLEAASAAEGGAVFRLADQPPAACTTAGSAASSSTVPAAPALARAPCSSSADGSLTRHLLSLPFQQRAALFCSQLHIRDPELQALLRHAPDAFAFDLE